MALQCFLALWVVTSWNHAAAADPNKPHLHQGQIPRLKMDGKPKVDLSQDDLARIEAGELYTFAREENNIGRAIGVKDIAATPHIIWDELTDIEGYVGKVPMLASLESYSKTKDVEKGTYKVKVVPGYYFEYYVEHYHSKDKRTLLFHLDYSRASDFYDMQGKWYLEDHPTKVGWTRVYYQCDLMLFGFAPAIVKKLLTTQGVSSSVAWVQQHSEKRAPRDLAAAHLTAVGRKSVPVFGITAGLLLVFFTAGIIRRRSKPRVHM